MSIAILVAGIVGSFIAAPLLMVATRPLYVLFVREGAELFTAVHLHREWAETLAGPLAVANILVFLLAWWVALTLSALDLAALVVMIPFIAAMAITMLITSLYIKSRLKLPTSDACTVGLLTFAGGNLPLFVLIPVLLIVVLTN